ncbi:hypothetical protein [Streptomyces cyaneus]|uniref:hypothetical protein n=1 Tax=Streptomyces cyaneus TaxID=1904 RepID=UPI000FF877BE|nr:hypothetical protein [Streptomyces cyaneus]
MGSVIVGVIGTLLGVAITSAYQLVHASRSRNWQREDSLRDVKRGVYTEYLRSISASYAQAKSHKRDRSEDARLLAATAEIEILSGSKVSCAARVLTDDVLRLHARIASRACVAKTEEPAMNDRRLALIDLFKTDLGIGNTPGPTKRPRLHWKPPFRRND